MKKRRLYYNGHFPSGFIKVLMVMKLTVLLILVNVYQVAAKVNAQTTVTLKLSKASAALDKIEKQGTYRFIYNSNLKVLSQKISIGVENAAIGDVLNYILAGTQLTYNMLADNLIVVREQPADGNVQQMDKIITGHVLDENGKPVPGASVVVKGTNNGTTTKEDGSFSLSIPDNAPDVVLVVTSVGYEKNEVPLEGKDDITIAIVAQAKEMNEVVVIGYGTSTKKDLTAPVSTVNIDDLNKRTTSSPMAGLQGSIAGVQVTNSGAPGSTPSVRIRGVGSLNNENPLYVVDGMFVDNIDFLNPSDIEDMSILKDASGAAIYGVRAANGVVLITTKKGRMNMKPRVTYNGYVGFQTPVNMLKMANGQQYAAMELGKGFASDSAKVTLSVAKFGGSGLNPSTSTDWYGELLRKNAFMQNHGIDIAGGTEKVNYAFGVNYLYQNGIMDAENSYNRYNIKLQTEAKPFSWLKAGYTVHLSNSTLFSPDNGAFTLAYYASPLYPVYDPANALARPVDFASSTSIGFNNGVFNNPVADAYYHYDRTKSFQVLPSVYAELNFWKNKLTFRSQLSQRLASNQNYNYQPEYYVDNNQHSVYEQTTLLSRLTSKQDRYTNYVLDNLLTYKDAAGDHHWTVLLGHSVREERWRNTSVSANDIPANQESWYVGLGTRNATDYTEDGSRFGGISYFARGTYDYKGTYLLTATIRADGSSKYQTKWGYFPSVGLGWVLSNESFLSDQNLFDFLKVRASWGRLGNDGIAGNAGYAKVYSGNDYSGVFGSTAFTNGALIPGYRVDARFSSLGWEVVEETDAGIDFTMADQKLKGTIDYYHRITNNLVFNRDNASVGGTTYGNFGKVVNSGLEFTLNWNDKIGNVGYNIGANLTTLKNKVSDLNSLAYQMTGISEYPTRMEIGKPLNFFYGYQVAGIYQTQAEVDADPIAEANGAVPGYFKFKDQNGDKVLDASDRVDLGSYLPKVIYGLNLGLEYKSFDISVVLQGQGGNKILNLNRALRSKYTDMNGDAEFVSNLWNGKGSTNKYPSAYATTQNYNSTASAFYVENGSYLRIQNVQLGYTFKAGKDDTRIRLYVTADRPAIFTRYSGFTPEVGNSDVTQQSNIGYDTNIYPVSATYSFGVRIIY